MLTTGGARIRTQLVIGALAESREVGRIDAELLTQILGGHRARVRAHMGVPAHSQANCRPA